MGMNDDRLNFGERDAPLFLAIKADDEKSAISGQMEVICGNIENTVHGQPFGSAGWHIMDNDWLTRPGIEDTPAFIDANLPGSHLLEAVSSRRSLFEWIKIVGLGITLLERASFLMCGNRD